MKYFEPYKAKHLKLFILSSFIGAILFGCGEESFSTKSSSDSLVTNAVETSSTSACASFTLVKPKVDFLFIWDNSSSTTFINDDTKEALSEVVENISDRFDYHVMLSPLVLESGKNINYQSRLIASNTDGLSGAAISMTIAPSYASSTLEGFDTAAGSLESGVSRSSDLIKANITNGVFRPGSYLYVVVMSNQDDNSWKEGESFPQESDRAEYTDEEVKNLLCLRGSYLPSSGSCTGINLNSTQLRFMNITSFSTSAESCSGITNFSKGQTYQNVSKIIYSEPYSYWSDLDGNGQLNSSSEITGTDSSRHLDQDERADQLYDSYDICNRASFTTIFDGINESIEQAIVAHKYNYWPVASSGASAIDPDEVEVFKDGVRISRLTEPVTNSSANGFSFTNTIQEVNTRYEPTAGESFEGYVVKLYGDARVTYPQCMQVKTQTPKEFYGYISMSAKPVESSIIVLINGVTIDQSATDGWQLIKSSGVAQYFSNKNIKITSTTDYTETLPAVNQSGYMVKLYGSAIYSNGATVEIFYDPAATN